MATRATAETRTPATPREGPSVTSRARLAGIALALLLFIVFMLQNLQRVEIHFLWFDGQTRMIWALLISGILGGVIAVAGSYLRARGRREAPR